MKKKRIKSREVFKCLYERRVKRIRTLRQNIHFQMQRIQRKDNNNLYLDGDPNAIENEGKKIDLKYGA